MKKKKNVLRYTMITLVILGVLYGLWWYVVKEKDKLKTSYLLTTNTITYSINDINNIDDIFTEVPNDYFIYISYTNSNKVYQLEQKLKKIIDKYKLNDNFYYIDITKIQETDNYFTKINEALKLDNKVNKAPVILYYKNNTLDSIVDNPKNLEDLLQVNEMEKMN